MFTHRYRTLNCRILVIMLFSGLLLGQARIEILNDPLNLKVGDTAQLEAIYIDDVNDTIDAEISWKIAPGSLGDINDNGLFTAERAGNGWISARKQGLRDSVAVTIEGGSPDDSLESLEIVNDLVQLHIGESEQARQLARQNMEISPVMWMLSSLTQLGADRG